MTQRSPRRALALGLLVLILPWPAGAKEATAKDSEAYSTLNPVPDNKLRDFSSDRPGKAQSAITVDVGRLQLESDFATLTYDPRGPAYTSTRAYAIGTPVLKYGVTSWMDVEIGSTLFGHLRINGLDGPVHANGLGDTLVGAKINLLGNDGGDQSFGVIQFVKIPTAARNLGNNHVEYTLLAPFTTKLPAEFSLTLQPTFAVLRTDANDGYRQDYGFVAGLSHTVLTDALTAYLDVAANASSEPHAKTKLTLDPALSYQLANNLQLDVGMYIGLNKATPKTQTYAGIAYRF